MHPSYWGVSTDVSDAVGINLLKRYLAVHLSTFCTAELALVPHFVVAFQDELIMSFKFPTIRKADYSHTVDAIW